MTYPSKAIANAFINRSVKDGKRITALKLQKLIYYAHGYYTAATGAPLIDENFEAWQYGPVVPSVYHEFKHLGSSVIAELATETDWDNEGLVAVPPPANNRKFDSIFEFIWNTYGKYSAGQLSELTHRDGTPWANTMRNNTFQIKNLDIPNEEIARYFSTFVKKKS